MWWGGGAGETLKNHSHSWLLTPSNTYITLLTGEGCRRAGSYYWHFKKGERVDCQELVQIRTLARSTLHKLQAWYPPSQTYLDFGPLPLSEHDSNSIITCQGWSHCSHAFPNTRQSPGSSFIRTMTFDFSLRRHSFIWLRFLKSQNL